MMWATRPPQSPEAPLLETSEWLRLADRHRIRVSRWVAGFRDRRARGTSHPVHDFLFRYYRYSPGKLEEWHPDVCTALRDSPEARERFEPPRYLARAGRIILDPGALRPKERVRLRWVRDLLAATSKRPPNLGCFGMHEWAMVYGGEDIRHRETVPLRLSQEEVDAFVESRPMVCSHYDAFRFFSTSARPMNRVTPTLSRRLELEQPGCVHANMDLYKWSYRSMPWIGTERLWRSFELALRLRALDMRASPYDLTSLGYEPIPVETEEGRRQYRREQLAFSEEAGRIRLRLIDALSQVLALAEATPPRSEPTAPVSGEGA
ncbi:MAG: 3-methyladenine DNA glycosylase [Gemmatimonadota bacterium]|jgi:hypothetical protein